jgi:hypothetical protein
MRGNRILPLTFNGRANLLAIVGRRGRLIRIWDVDAGQIIGRFRAAGRVHVLAFTIDGWRLAAGGRRGQFRAGMGSQPGWRGGTALARRESHGAGLQRRWIVPGYRGADSISRIWRFNRPLSRFEEQDPLP